MHTYNTQTQKLTAFTAREKAGVSAGGEHPLGMQNTLVFLHVMKPRRCNYAYKCNITAALNFAYLSSMF